MYMRHQQKEVHACSVRPIFYTVQLTDGLNIGENLKDEGGLNRIN